MLAFLSAQEPFAVQQTIKSMLSKQARINLVLGKFGKKRKQFDTNLNKIGVQQGVQGDQKEFNNRFD